MNVESKGISQVEKKLYAMGALPKKRSISFLSDDELGAQNNDWYRIVTEFNIQFATVTKLPLFFLPAETCNSQELGTPEPGGISSLALSPIFFYVLERIFLQNMYVLIFSSCGNEGVVLIVSFFLPIQIEYLRPSISTRTCDAQRLGAWPQMMMY